MHMLTHSLAESITINWRNPSSLSHMKTWIFFFKICSTAAPPLRIELGLKAPAQLKHIPPIRRVNSVIWIVSESNVTWTVHMNSKRRRLLSALWGIQLSTLRPLFQATTSWLEGILRIWFHDLHGKWNEIKLYQIKRKIL